MTFESGGELAVHYQRLEKLRKQINSVVIGQQSVVDQLLVTLLAQGHLLLEGVPGLGKTLLVQTVATALAVTYKRIQFTPDMMPADITGHTLYDMREGSFRIRRGPVFTNLLLADEINRAPAKTQAALLEVMQEMQVTIEGESMPLQAPFLVMATQNPLEQEGTYPLPEAELDRFLLKVVMAYPSEEDERILTRKVVDGGIEHALQACQAEDLTAEAIGQLQALCRKVTVDTSVIEYATRLVRATRQSNSFIQGAGPRATIGLIRCARAQALLNGRDYVLPDDVKQLAKAVLRHRVQLSAEAEIDGINTDEVLESLLAEIEVPR